MRGAGVQTPCGRQAPLCPPDPPEQVKHFSVVHQHLTAVKQRSLPIKHDVTHDVTSATQLMNTACRGNTILVVPPIDDSYSRPVILLVLRTLRYLVNSNAHMYFEYVILLVGLPFTIHTSLVTTVEIGASTLYSSEKTSHPLKDDNNSSGAPMR